MLVSISWEALPVLGTIFDAAGVERAPVLGISQGAAVAAAYAARNPGRVSALILIGGCSRGWRVKRTAVLHERFEAMMSLMRHGWGGRNAAFRQIFTTAFFPEASKQHTEWFNELQRQTASPENAAKIYLGFVVAFWSTPAMTLAHLLFAAATTGYILVAVQLEERDMVRIHGARYQAYREQVSMLVPRPPKKTMGPLQG